MVDEKVKAALKACISFFCVVGIFRNQSGKKKFQIFPRSIYELFHYSVGLAALKACQKL